MAANGADANTSLTSSLAQEVKTYYDKVFLARAEYELILEEGGQKRTHPANEGRTVNFTRYNPLTIITTPLGEASNPTTCSINASTVAMTLSEYGLTTTHSRLLTTVSIDSSMKEKIGLVGQNMGETLNRLVRLELANGTSYYGNNHTVSTFTAGDVLDACNIRLMVQTLEIAKAPVYKDGVLHW
jgi:N4-gp56 family major capsid protein